MREIRKSAVVRIAPLLAMALAGFDARAESFEPAPDGADVEAIVVVFAGVDYEAIVRRADRALHGEQTNLEGKLHVESRRGRTRESFRFRVFEDRLADRSFLRVEPLADEPSGSEPGQWRSANRRFTSTTGGASSASASVSARPASTSTPKASR